MNMLATDTFKKNVGVWIRKPVSIWDDHFMQRNTSPLHLIYQAVDCGLWNVVSLLFNGCEVAG